MTNHSPPSQGGVRGWVYLFKVSIQFLQSATNAEDHHLVAFTQNRATTYQLSFAIAYHSTDVHATRKTDVLTSSFVTREPFFTMNSATSASATVSIFMLSTLDFNSIS